MLSHAFMRYAFLAGTGIGLASGLVGYFLVLRSQVFTVDALSHVAFTGSLAALAIGLDARVGLFAATALVAAAMGGLGRRGRADDALTGSVFAWILGLGVLFLTLYTRSHSSRQGNAGVSVLFGSILGLSRGQAVVAAGVGMAIAVAVVAIARPLLFSTIDGAVAAARGVPVRALGFAFLLLVGLAAAEASQAVGALLLLGLVAAPGATAMRLTTRPYLAIALSGALAVGSVWVGLALSYEIAALPPSFAILAVATSAYGVAALSDWRRARSAEAAGADA